MQEMKEKYIIITSFPYEGSDVSYYDNLEEAIEDYNPTDWHQELYKVVQIIP